MFRRTKRVLVLIGLGAWASCAACLAQTNADFFFYASRSDYDAGDYHAALTNVARGLELDPRRPDAFFMRGLCKHEIGDYRGAIADYDKAIHLNPKAGGYYCGRGRSEFVLKD